MLKNMLDARNTLEGKLLAVLMSIVLVMSMTNIFAFAGDEGEGAPAADSATVEQPAQEPAADMQSAEPQVAVPDQKSVPGSNESAQSDVVERASGTTAVAPLVSEALVKFEAESAYVTVSDQQLEGVEPSLTVPLHKELAFRASGAAGFEVSEIKARNEANADVPVIAQGESGDAFAIAAEYVDSTLVVTVVTERAAFDEPAVETTPITSDTKIEAGVELKQDAVEIPESKPIGEPAIGAINQEPSLLGEGSIEVFATYEAHVNFLYNNDSLAAQPFAVQRAASNTSAISVKVPRIAGYATEVGELDPAAGTATLDDEGNLLIEPTGAADINITVRYSGKKADYTVHHLFENLSVDDTSGVEYNGKHYAEDESLKGTAQGDVEMATSAQGTVREGFMQSAIVNDIVKSDGTTDAYVYYDRQSYTVSFDSGVGVVEYRFGQEVEAKDPQHEGYTFKGWDFANDKGEPVELVDGAMPARDLSATAQWEAAEAEYEVSVWVQNANDDGYSYATSFRQKALTGDEVGGSSWLEGNGDAVKNAFAGTLPQNTGYTEIDYYNLNSDKSAKAATVSGDGTTTVNVYYDRNEYFIKFYYARVNNNNGKVFAPTATDSGTLTGAGTTWAELGQLKDLTMPVGGTPEVIDKFTYYYYTLSAKYGQDISAQWPASPIDAIGSWKFISWGVQKGSGYWNAHNTGSDKNKNIKGVYSTMSAELIMDPSVSQAQYMVAYGKMADIYNYTYVIYYENIDGSGYSKVKSYEGIRSTDTGKGQNALSFPGVTFDNKKKYFNAKGKELTEAQGKDMKGGTIEFYYTRNDVPIALKNVNADYSPAKVTEAMAKQGIRVEDGSLVGKYGSDISVLEELDDLTYPLAKGAKDWTFTGWCSDPAGTVPCFADGAAHELGTEGVVLYAGWKAPDYEVSFKLNGGTWESGSGKSITQQVAEGATPVDVGSPVREGYTFGGWYDASGARFFFTNGIYDDVTLTARWVPNAVRYEYKFVCLDSKTGADLTDRVDDASALTGTAPANEPVAIKAPTIKGYATAQGVVNTTITDDTTITIYYTPATTYEYVVKYVDEQGNPVKEPSVRNEVYTEIVELAPAIPHYDVVDSEQQGCVWVEDAENVITFVYKLREYQITYLPGDHGTFESQEHKATYGMDTPGFSGDISGDAGWSFDGWDPDIVDTVEGSMTYTATWKARTDTGYKVEHYQQNLAGNRYDLVETESLEGTTEQTAVASIKDYAGFSHNPAIEGTLLFGTIAGDGSLVLKVYYDRLSFEVAYAYANEAPDGAAALPSTVSYKYGQVVTVAGNASVPGYAFSGWGSDDAAVTAGGTFTMPAKNVAITGSWTPKADTKYLVEHYQQNLAGDGYVLAKTERLTGTTGQLATAAVKEFAGFSFNGDAEGTLRSGIIAGDGSLVLKLYYDRDLFAVAGSIDANGVIEGNANQAIRFQGSSEPMTFRANEGYRIASIVVDGASVSVEPGMTTYVFDAISSVEEDHEVAVATAPIGSIVATAPSDSKIYDGSPVLYGAPQFVGLPDGYTATAQVEGSQTDVGSSTTSIIAGSIVIRDASNADVTSNFAVETRDGSLKVTERAVILTSADDSKPYDGTPLVNHKVTVGGDGFVEGQEPSYDVTGSATNVADSREGNNAFTYRLPDGAKASNYHVTTEFGTLTIEAAPASQLGLQTASASKPYDGTLLSTTASATVVEGTTIEYSVDDGATWMTDAPGITNAGTRAVLVRATNDNYDPAEGAYTLSVSKANATVNADDKTRAYGEENPRLTYSQSGFVNGESLESLGVVASLTTTATETSSTGSYPIEFTDQTIETDNYRIAYQPGTLTVTQNANAIVISANDASRDYNGQALTESGFTYTGTLAAGDYLEVAMSDASIITNAGSRPNEIGSFVVKNATGQDVTGNYADIATVAGTLTVNKVNATVFADGKTKTYGEENPRLTYSQAGFINGESIESLGIVPSLMTTATAESPVGSYPIEFSGQIAETDNYVITYSPGTLTVSPVASPVVVTIAGNSATYVYDATEKAVTGYEVVGISNPLYAKADIVFSGSAAVARTDVGTAAMGLTAAGFANGNANFTNVEFNVEDGEVRIDPATVTITATNAGKTYGQADPELGAEVSGLQGADEFTGSYDVVREAGEEPGDYAVTVDKAVFDNDNYVVETQAGTFTIVPIGEAALVVASETRIYDGISLEPRSFQPVGLAEDDYFDDVVYEGSQTAAGESEGTVASYVIRNTAGDDVTANYGVVIVKPGTLRVDPAPATITVTSASKIAGTDDPAFTGTVSGLVNDGDLGEIVYVRSNGAESPGVYSDALTALYDSNGNYKVTVVPGTFTIVTAPAPVPVPATPVGPTPTPTPTPPGTPPADNPLTPIVAPIVDALATAAETVIGDNATPLAAGEGEPREARIGDNGTPLAEGAHAWCWVHWYIILGIIVTAVYAACVALRRGLFSRKLKKYEDNLTGGGDPAPGAPTTDEGGAAPAAPVGTPARAGATMAVGLGE